MTKRQKRDLGFIVTFEGKERCPFEFYTRTQAEQIAKHLNRRGNYKFYKAENFGQYLDKKWSEKHS